MEKIIYDSKKRILHYETEDKRRRKKKLSINEGKLLMLLSDNQLHLYKEVDEFIYGNSETIKKVTINGIRHIRAYKSRTGTLLCRLKKRIKYFNELEIKNKISIGYYMKGDMYIE